MNGRPPAGDCPQPGRRALLRALPLAVGALALGAGGSAGAWHRRGHEAIARHATGQLPERVPAWFRGAGDAVAHGSMHADLFKHPGLPELTRPEQPEHYFNLERLDGAPLPPDRYALLAWAHERGLEPRQVGLLPYAIVEWTQRLTLAFAEHRRWPEDPHIESLCVAYAGILSHYTGDLTMPLHTTVHHNGRVGEGRGPRSDIHQRVDALLDRLPLDDPGLLDGLEVTYDPGGDALAAVEEALLASHARVDRVYELYDEVPPPGTGRIRSPAVRALAVERYRHGVAFTASRFLTAWERSDGISLPRWRTRD